MAESESRLNTSNTYRHLFLQVLYTDMDLFLNISNKDLWVKKIRTVMYYCRPYRASERGSNENANKLIRRFIIPKGTDISTISETDISTISEDEIKHIENYINNYFHKSASIKPEPQKNCDN